MTLYDKIVSGEEKIALVGLGYVGMPIALAFAKKAQVIGFDLNKEKIAQYQRGSDPTHEVGDQAIKDTTVVFTSDEALLQGAKFHIIAVPTPINPDKTPDLKAVISASQTVGRNLTPGSIVVYESTVYPGVTEEVCLPVLEKASGMRAGVDFQVGYSPERINPGDKVHTLTNITKIVSAMDARSLDVIAKVYEMVIEAGVFRAGSIRVAEAAKVVENSQRDINIAFMNELAMVFDRMGIDTAEVVEAMNTKWNALGFTPGLVGGHCIGIDPYYFVYEAERLGYHSQIILAGRMVNDGMGAFVADALIKQLVLSGKPVRSARVAILGLVFKENCPDIRNTRVVDILARLEEYGIEPIVCDPEADPDEARREYGIALAELSEIKDMDAVVIAVAHEAFRKLSMEEIGRLFAPGASEGKVLIDVKSILDAKAVQKIGYRYWRL